MMRHALILAAIAVLAPACGKGGSNARTALPTTSPKVLMFVAYNRVWWAEYKVAFEALRAAGYEVDVRSSGTGFATSYQTDGGVETSADSHAGSTYAAFAASYASTFGSAWDASWNAPAQIPVAGRIQEVASLADYQAVAVVGGVGAVDYRYDGTYADTVDGAHVGSAADVQAAAEKLNQLVSEAIQTGKPVLAECHAATLPAYARVAGHFISTYGVAYGASATMPPGGFPASPAPSNPSASGYPSFAITDEIYNNTAFTGTPSFGDGINQIRPLFANDCTASPGQVHTAGFTKRFDWNGDGTAGRLVYLQAGERVENFVIGSPYAQVVRNALVWAGHP